MMRNDPDGEYSLLMFASMLVGTAIVWIALFGCYLTIPFTFDASQPTGTMEWLAWTSVIISVIVEILGIVFLTMPLDRGERIGLVVIMACASVPIWPIVLQGVV